jgi:hypothetical protein
VAGVPIGLNLSPAVTFVSNVTKAISIISIMQCPYKDFCFLEYVVYKRKYCDLVNNRSGISINLQLRVFLNRVLRRISGHRWKNRRFENVA